MQKNQAILLVVLLTTVLGYMSMTSEKSTNFLRVGKVPQTVPYVDISKYLGRWYEQALIPYYFQRDCTKSTADYSMNKDGTIKVVNGCQRHGKLVQNTGKAIPEDKTNAKLKIEFIQTLDVGGQYWIVRLPEDYSYSVISSPNYRFLWILYRQPNMPQDLYNSIIDDLKKDGFPVEKLKRTQQ